jgi:hypothetical protein
MSNTFKRLSKDWKSHEDVPIEEIRRVEITRPIMVREAGPLFGLTVMQVCVVSDATDEEILSVCNKENHAGTTSGWVTVVRETMGRYEGPTTCGDIPNRQHVLVTC